MGLHEVELGVGVLTQELDGLKNGQHHQTQEDAVFHGGRAAAMGSESIRASRQGFTGVSALLLTESVGNADF